MKVIDEISKKYNLNEAGQGTTVMKFALFNKDSQETMTPFCQCKDYFNDVFWVKHTGKDCINQYGFTFKAGEDKGVLDKEELSLVIKIVDNQKTLPADQDKIDNILSLINKMEEANGFISSYTEIAEDNIHFVLTFDKKWTDIPYLCSAFFLFLRIGYKYDRKTDIKEYYKDSKNFLSMHDNTYFNSGISLIEGIQKGELDNNQKYSDYPTQSNAHNQSGIVGYSCKFKLAMNAKLKAIEKTELVIF